MSPGPVSGSGPGPEAEDRIPPETEGLIGAAFLALAVLLAALLPAATETQPAGKAWFLSPRNAPLLGLGMMALPGLLLGLRALRGWRAAGDRAAYARRMAFAFRDLGPGLGFAALFCAYLFALPLAGFALSTLAFGQACLWLAGLRSLRWAGWNLLFAVIVVLVLRAGMGLWFPHAALFDWLPGGLGNAVSPYL